MFKFNIFKSYSQKLISGVTRKEMGSFRETDPEFPKNIENLGLGKPVLANQTHSDLILEVNEPFLELQEADAFITQKKDLLLMIKVADCQGIVIYDPCKEALAVVHSGWKGSTKNIIGKTIEKMKTTFNSEATDLLMAISPSLGPCCAEFTDPQSELPEFCHPFIIKNNHVNFWQLSKKQAMDEGVLESNIEIAKLCSKDDPHSFSFRLGEEGRMGVFGKLI